MGHQTAVPVRDPYRDSLFSVCYLSDFRCHLLFKMTAEYPVGNIIIQKKAECVNFTQSRIFDRGFAEIKVLY